MARLKSAPPTIVESTVYDPLITKMESKGIKPGHRPPQPKKELPLYPFTVKVHTWTRGDTEKLAQTLGMSLSSDQRKLVFKASAKTRATEAVFVEKRLNPFPKRTSHIDRVEAKLWTDTVAYTNNGWRSYLTFDVVIQTEADFKTFCRKIGQRLSPDTRFVNYPTRKERVWRYHWVSKHPEINLRYPVYIISKGRADSRYTTKCFHRIGVPFHVVVEPQEYDEYACVIGEQRLIKAPFSNHGMGSGRARNFAWDHAKANGFKRHWIFDDNIVDFYRLYGNRKLPIADGGMFRVCEEFVDRFSNVPVAGLNYDYFIVPHSPYPPFVRNTKNYSSLLIDTSCPIRWRGKFNEDVILCLDVLKAGLCTIQFNCLLAGKKGTQSVRGGNTEELYKTDGTWYKSEMLATVHSDVAKVVWRYGRWHHEVDWKRFQGNALEFVQGYDPALNRAETDKFVFHRVKDYFDKVQKGLL